MIVKGYVYLIKFTLGGEVRFKIGFSADPQRRMDDFTTPGVLELVDQYAHEEPSKLEKRLHKRFSHRRQGKSEWFQLTDREVAEFSRAVTEESVGLTVSTFESVSVVVDEEKRKAARERQIDAIARLLLSLPPCPSST